MYPTLAPKTWLIQVHIWPIYGNGMGRKSGGMELIWDLILAKCKLWDMYGKKSRCPLLYGRSMGMHSP